MKFPSLIPVGRERNAFAQPFVSLQREIDRLFEDFGRGFPSLAGGNGGGNGSMLMPSTRLTRRSRSPPNYLASKRRTCRSISPTAC